MKTEVISERELLEWLHEQDATIIDLVLNPETGVWEVEDELEGSPHA